MRILFQHEKARRASSELLTLSRTVRQSAYEAEDVMRNLRLETEFAVCNLICAQMPSGSGTVFSFAAMEFTAMSGQTYCGAGSVSAARSKERSRSSAA